jgi:hypothetical protein
VILGFLLLLFVLGRSIVGWFLENHPRHGSSIADEAQEWLTTPPSSE